MNALQKIAPDSLVCMKSTAEMRIDVAYAREDNLLFGERIYREDAQLWLHEDLAAIVKKASETLFQQGFRLVLYDGLRTTDAQAKMLETRTVKANLHWLAEPRLLSPPGAGAHPRAMAVDCTLETKSGKLLDMGTPFDFLAETPAAEGNPAHRNHPHHNASIIENRRILNDAMLEAAQSLNTALFLLPQEWWDFRLPIYEDFEALSDDDLHPEMRMCD